MDGGFISSDAIGSIAVGSAFGSRNGAIAKGDGATVIGSRTPTTGGAQFFWKGSVAYGSGGYASRDLTEASAGTATGIKAIANAGGVAIGDGTISGDPGAAMGTAVTAIGVDAVAVGF